MITHPTTSHAMAFGLPLETAIAQLEASAAELSRSAERVGAERNENSFGAIISAAVKRKLRARSGSISAESDQGETFGEKLKKAVGKRIGDRSQRAKKDAARYRPIKPRPRTASD